MCLCFEEGVQGQPGQLLACLRLCLSYAFTPGIEFCSALSCERQQETGLTACVCAWMGRFYSIKGAVTPCQLYPISGGEIPGIRVGTCFLFTTAFVPGTSCIYTTLAVSMSPVWYLILRENGDYIPGQSDTFCRIILVLYVPGTWYILVMMYSRSIFLLTKRNRTREKLISFPPPPQKRRNRKGIR